MPNIKNLQISDFKKHFTTASLRKAKSYRHRVKNPVRRNGELIAEVIGTRRYHVEIEITPTAIEAFCTCPYDWGGYCKHIGAVLLLWMENPQAFTDEGDTDTPRARTDPSVLKTIPVEAPEVHPYTKFPLWTTQSPADYYAEDTEFLARSLDGWRMQDLRALASNRGWRIKGARKTAFIEQLVQKLTDPAEIQIAYQSLDAEHRQVLHALTSSEMLSWLTEKEFHQFASTWGKLKRYKKIGNYIEHLIDLGLTGFDEGAIAINRHLPPFPLPSNSIPESTNQHLCDPYGLVNRTIQLIILLEKNPTELRPPQPRPQLEKIHQPLQEWDYVPEEVLALKNKQPYQINRNHTMTVPPPQYALPDEAIAQLAPIAGGETQLDFIYHLLVQGHIIHLGSPVTVWTEVKTKFLQLSVNRQRALLAQLYFNTQDWNELWSLLRQNKNLRLKRLWSGYNAPHDLKYRLLEFRWLVLRVLANFPDNTWIALDTIEHIFKQFWRTFHEETLYNSYYSDRPGWALYINNKPLKSEKKTRDWEQAQGAFIRYILTAPLHWLGLTDLQFDDKSQLQAVRFLGFRDIFLGINFAPDAPYREQNAQTDDNASASISINGKHIAIPLAAMNARINVLMDKCAHLDNVTSEQLNYQLSAEITWQSFEAGETLDDLRKTWQENMPIEMPNSIRQTLETWWQGYGKVRIYQNMTLIEFSDDHSLAEMKAVTTLNEHLIAEISPRLIVIKKEATQQLIAELEKAGYTPKQTTQVTA